MRTIGLRKRWWACKKLVNGFTHYRRNTARSCNPGQGVNQSGSVRVEPRQGGPGTGRPDMLLRRCGDSLTPQTSAIIETDWSRQVIWHNGIRVAAGSLVNHEAEGLGSPIFAPSPLSSPQGFWVLGFGLIHDFFQFRGVSKEHCLGRAWITCSKGQSSPPWISSCPQAYLEVHGT